MAIVVPVTYQNSMQQLTWSYGNVSATAYLWGGGGGGGGTNGAQSGGTGGGGGYSQLTFTVSNGDVLQLAVANAGNHGFTGSGIGGGAGGASYYNSSTVVSYSGGGGGSSGNGGSRGSGGGSGGATVLFKNNLVIAVAGGGGGGGGAGQNGVTPGFDGNAPGPWGLAAVDVTSGQNGGSHPSTGGGGGAGGGGYQGGNAGYWGGATPASPNSVGDNTGTGGTNGSNFGSVTTAPTGRFPAANTSPYYSGSAGQGGLSDSPGVAGRAVIVFDTNPLFINVGNAWVQPTSVYVREAGVWSNTQAIYVKENGIWYPLVGSATTFATVAGNWGTFARTAPAYVPPMGMGMGMGGDGGDGIGMGMGAMGSMGSMGAMGMGGGSDDADGDGDSGGE